MEKKEREYSIVAGLINMEGLTLVNRRDEERPDFVCEDESKRRIGIEITDVLDIARNPVVETEKAVDKLLAKYTKSRMGLFSGLHIVKIDQFLIHSGECFKLHEKQLFDELDRILLGEIKCGEIVESAISYPSREFMVSRSPGHFTLVHSLPLNLLLKRVEDKEQKLIEYRAKQENVDLGIIEYWLVVNIPLKEGWDMCGYQNISVTSGYDKVFLYDGYQYGSLK